MKKTEQRRAHPHKEHNTLKGKVSMKSFNEPKSHMGIKGHYKNNDLERILTEDEIRTLQDARLIHLHKSNLKVGEVKTTETGYVVAIVTKKENALVEHLNVAKNGMPLEYFNAVLQKREHKKHSKHH